MIAPVARPRELSPDTAEFIVGLWKWFAWSGWITESGSTFV
jgi:hypothetical protein